MDFAYSDRVKDLRARVCDFVATRLLPANRAFHHEVAAGRYPMALIDGFKAEARARGLWNLFLPGLGCDEPGTRLANLEYAPLAEIMGRLPWASEVFNCNAPDTGNMEVLHLFATPDQRRDWLAPLLDGRIRSIVCMTEPDVSSSDPTNVETTIRRDGAHYVLNGRKWFSTGAIHPNCAVALVFGVTDPDADRHRRHSFVLVPTDAPGFEMMRNVPIMHHLAPEGHCEMRLKDVRVPVANMIAAEGDGFRIAQARLGPGRVHHCMRTIGQCELALELMCDRALAREVFGQSLSRFANVQDWIAEARIEIDQLRLLVLRAAWRMDREGNHAARVDVSAIKLAAARLQTRVLDRAIQVFGAAGLTPDTPLSYLWTWGRALRFIDGPDEVHLMIVAREEIRRAKAAGERNADHFVPPPI